MTIQPPRLATALTVWQAWWEDYSWDGQALYLDVETAKENAARDYVGEEYGHWDDEDDAPDTKPCLTWAEEHGSWHLLNHGKSTNVQVSPTSVYRPATEREIRQQDALQAAEAAARASKAQQPMAEQLSALVGTGEQR